MQHVNHEIYITEDLLRGKKEKGNYLCEQNLLDNTENKTAV